MKIIVNLNEKYVAWKDSEISVNIDNFISNFSQGPKYCKSWSNGYVSYSSLTDTLTFYTSNWLVVYYIRYKFLSVPIENRPEIVFNIYQHKNVPHDKYFQFDIDYSSIPCITQFNTWLSSVEFWRDDKMPEYTSVGEDE